MITLEKDHLKISKLWLNLLTLRVTNARLLRRKRLNRGAANLSNKSLVRLPIEPQQKRVDIPEHIDPFR